MNITRKRNYFLTIETQNYIIIFEKCKQIIDKLHKLYFEYKCYMEK